MTNRRNALKSLGLGAFLWGGAATAETRAANPAPTWARGIEGQRKADLGNGTYLNPIMSGDHPDPSILKDGQDYYMTFSSFEAYPGLVIWHSRDLVNWTPVGPALTHYIGSVWAPELCKHNGRYFLYIPTVTTANPASKKTTWVIWADDIRGPWSDPIDLNISAQIDPGHAVGEDGSRWLFLSMGDRVRLTEDGLRTIGAVEHIYDPWQFPPETDAEGFAPEGPKIMRHGDYFYMILAIGGTAGPVTGHMVIAARSRSINGPWEHHPRNPLVNTRSKAEKWWSRGHATLIEGPAKDGAAGDWWAVYHGYENGFWTLGRQTLLAPVSWAKDGWPDFGGGDLSQPLPKPGGGLSGPHGQALSDDFLSDKYGVQWTFFNPSPDEGARLRRDNGILHIKATGTTPSDSSPLQFTAGEQDYECECEIEVDDGVRAGLLMFYDSQLYAGVSFDAKRFVSYKYGLEHSHPANPFGRHLFMRMRNSENVVRFHISADGVNWQRYERTFEVSGYHHNVRGGFMALKPALIVTGAGEARFRNFRFRACEPSGTE